MTVYFQARADRENRPTRRNSRARIRPLARAVDTPGSGRVGSGRNFTMRPNCGLSLVLFSASRQTPGEVILVKCFGSKVDERGGEAGGG